MVAADPTNRSVIERLRADVAGTVVAEGDLTYEDARRVWNGMIERRPAAVVGAAGADDVSRVIAIARESGLPLAVRAGGHNVAGNGTVDNGIVLDLGGLRSVEVDAATRTVRVAAGATLADLDAATQAHGLVVPSGVISATGVAGLTLGGGVGWLTRSYGLTIDSLIAAEVVTASGEMVRASEDENPELFWGLRGGGGNFGVVTSFTFRAYPLGPDVHAGNLVYGRERWPEALRAYAAWTAQLPDELNSIISFMVPPADWELGDDAVMLVGFIWAGPVSDEATRLLDDLVAAAAPDADVREPATWIAWQSAADSLFPKGVRAWWKNAAIDRLDDAAISTIVEHAGRLTSRGTAADIHHFGGGFARVPEDATAFPNRSAEYWLNIYGFWPDSADDADRIAWVRGFHAAMEQQAAAGEYVNFLGRDERGDTRARALAAYGPRKLARLVELKRRYDPTNLFRLNHNIPVD
jgi:FAD/FMN-containing dehydrogenase